jgi:DNA-binding HxlR family transcriptional regulator
MGKSLNYSSFLEALSVLNRPKKFLIVYHLLDGKKRFGEIKALSGIKGPTTLTNLLHELVASQLVKRKGYLETPLRVEYSLTEKGYSLKPIINALVRWGAGVAGKEKGQS